VSEALLFGEKGQAVAQAQDGEGRAGT